MELIKSFRNPSAVKKTAEQIHKVVGESRFKIMEVCGGQTHTIYKYRLKEILPPGLKLVSGPGCPVCVTPVSYIDKAIALTLDKGVTVFTFGDLIRVPGSFISLEKAAAEGGRVETVYSPLQAVQFAASHPDKEVAFLGIGFETTVPSLGLAVLEAAKRNFGNFSLLLSAKRVPPVLDALLAAEQVEINGFITPGHVTAIIGVDAYNEICQKYRVPLVCGGFEPLDLLLAIKRLAELLAAGEWANENAYARVTTQAGNQKGQQVIQSVFQSSEDELRGLGMIGNSGYAIRPAYEKFDAEKKYQLKVKSHEPKGCICGLILAGRKEPGDCPLFRKKCSPDSPVGACMVSSEGCCNAAWLFND